jgi:tryptophan halogenase
MKKRKIVIIGGGSAGWMTALFIKKMYDVDADVTLIESEDIGILGAGEGSTPNFPGMLNFLGIDFKEFLIKTNATHKLGISFINWNGDGKLYRHPFGNFNLKYNWTVKENMPKLTKYLGYLYKNNTSHEDNILSNRLINNNLSPLLKTQDDNGAENSVDYGFHFDAHLVAKYLRKIAERRKIKRIEGIVNGFKLDNSDNIKKIILKDGQRIDADFVFDCSGFNRVVIGKLYKTNWISYADSLKVTSALTFQLPQDSGYIKPYTKAIAMKYGWMWMIPLQNRIGCGYNFDENFTTIEEAKAEVEEFFGKKIEFNRAIPYNAGRFEKLWVKNCIAVGLSGGFAEPIEATSIFTSVNQLFSLDVPSIERVINGDSAPANEHNENAAKFMDRVKDFLQFHYFTKRTDTEFWKSYYDSSNKSNELLEKINKWKTKIPEQLDFDKEPFDLYNWINVGLGLEFYNSDEFKKTLSEQDYIEMEKWHNEQQAYIKKIYESSIDEVECIELIKSLYYYG